MYALRKMLSGLPGLRGDGVPSPPVCGHDRARRVGGADGLPGHLELPVLYACLERCPRSVEPARLVEAARLLVIRQAGKNHLLPDQIPAMLDSEIPQQALVSALRKYGK